MMVRYHDEDERESISWREIDRRRDRSPHAPRETPEPRRKSQRSEWLKKRYRKEIDKLFMGKKGTKKHQEALSNIERTHGTEEFEEAVRAYVEQYGLPDDWSVLSLMLDCSDTAKVAEVLSVMRNLYPTRSSAEKQAFKAKLDILAMTAKDNEVRDLAEEILRNF